MDKNKKKQVAKISVFITSIFVIFLSITYAFINMTVTGTKRQVITSGNLQVELEEDNVITLTNAMPMYDDVGMLQDAFNFRLVNQTSEDTNYIIKLVDITDVSKEKLDTSVVKYGLTKDGVSTINLLSTLTDNQIDSGKISGNQTIHYSLRLWINNTVTDNDSINNKMLSYRIDVEVKQDVDTFADDLGPGGTMKSYQCYSLGAANGLDCSRSEDYMQYPINAQIKSIVFENKINIPASLDEDKKWDVSEEQNGSVMAYVENAGTFIDYDEVENPAYRLHIQANGKIYANTDSDYMFAGEFFSHLESISGLENFDTSKVTSMQGMFYYSGLKTLDLSHFDISNVTDMSLMFYFCNGLTDLNISNFDVLDAEKVKEIFGTGIPNDCLITVKNEAMKALILEQNSELTNIVVKSA